MTIVTTEYLTFDQHPEVIQQIIIDKHRDINVDHEWYDSEMEYFTKGLESIGFDDIKVFFSGFSCQGDGAQFLGSYTFPKGEKVLAKIKEEYPEWTALHTLASALQEASRKHFYGVTFSIRSDGHYSHEKCTSFDFEGYTEHRRDFWLNYEQELEFIEPCREFMREIYRSLRTTYYALTESDAIKETLISNNSEFSSDGTVLTQ